MKDFLKNNQWLLCFTSTLFVTILIFNYSELSSSPSKKAVCFYLVSLMSGIKQTNLWIKNKNFHLIKTNSLMLISLLLVGLFILVMTFRSGDGQENFFWGYFILLPIFFLFFFLQFLIWLTILIQKLRKNFSQKDGVKNENFS